MRSAVGRIVSVTALVAILFALFGLPSSVQAAVTVAIVGALMCALASTALLTSRSWTTVPVRARTRG